MEVNITIWDSNTSIKASVDGYKYETWETDSEELKLQPDIYYRCFRLNIFQKKKKLHCGCTGFISSHRLQEEKWATKQQKATHEGASVSSASCPGYRNMKNTAVNSASNCVSDDSESSCNEMADSILLIQREERERETVILCCPLALSVNTPAICHSKATLL